MFFHTVRERYRKIYFTTLSIALLSVLISFRYWNYGYLQHIQLSQFKIYFNLIIISIKFDWARKSSEKEQQIFFRMLWSSSFWAIILENSFKHQPSSAGNLLVLIKRKRVRRKNQKLQKISWWGIPSSLEIIDWFFRYFTRPLFILFLL